jgi:hypothetical protein
MGSVAQNLRKCSSMCVKDYQCVKDHQTTVVQSEIQESLACCDVDPEPNLLEKPNREHRGTPGLQWWFFLIHSHGIVAEATTKLHWVHQSFGFWWSSIPSSSRTILASLPITGNPSTWRWACSELAWRRAYRAAIPCEMTDSLDTVPLVWQIIYTTRLRRTRNSIQLRTKTISRMGYGWFVSLQYSCSRSSSAMGTSWDVPLKPCMMKDESDRMPSFMFIDHGCVKFPRSASCQIRISAW